MNRKPKTLLEAAREGVRHLLGWPQGSAAADNQKAKPAAPNEPRAGDPEAPETLRRLLAGRSVLAVGKLSFIGLADLKSNLGPSSARLEQRVNAAAASVIRKRLGPGDAFIELDGEGFVLVFDQISGAEAEAKCAMIAHDIKTWLMGVDAAASSSLSHEVAQIAVAELLRNGGPDLATVLCQGVSHDDGAGGQRDSPTAASSASSPKTPALDAAKSKSTHIPRFRFEPIWDARNEALLYFRPVIATPDSASAAVECAALRCAQAELGRLSAAGRGIPVWLSLEPDAVSDVGRRNAFRQALQETPLELRPRFVVEIPAEASGAHALAESVRSMRMATALRCQIAGQDADRIRRLGPQVLSVDVSGWEASGLILAALERFAATAASWRAEACLFGASSLSMATAAATSGFRFLAGPAIHTPVESLDDVVRFAPRDLFARGRTL